AGDLHGQRLHWPAGEEGAAEGAMQFTPGVACGRHRRGIKRSVIFKKTFKFTGGEIVGEFLMSVGYLPGAHDENCPIYKKIAKLKPAWNR
ncbi:MAG: hypothetical protein QGG84_10400, partial [Rhodospirillales bacterium]|nr:hypothetical protein [Rhodospirillales bacterium]